MLVYGLTLANGSKVTNMAVSGGAALPVTAVPGQLFFLTTDNYLYLYDGSGWVNLAEASGGGGSDNHVKVPFSYNSTSPLNIVLMGSSKFIYDARLIIETPFDTPATLEVGDSENPGRLLAATENDPQQATAFESSPNYKYPSNTQIQLTITPNGATQGSGFVILTVEL